MAKYFDEDKWADALKYNDWYLRIKDDYKAVVELAQGSEQEESKKIKNEVRGWFEERIDKHEIALATEGEDLDIQRQSIDTVVIHHTSAAATYSLKRMNVTHLLNIYVPYYTNPHVKGEEHLKGKPIWSNHFKDGQQVFYAYHWFIRMDGSIERLLDDDKIGWQAGNWEINCRSVGICLDNDYQDTTPKSDIISALAVLINEKYGNVRSDRIIGHREVNSKTSCPGNQFLGGWKEQLLERVNG